MSYNESFLELKTLKKPHQHPSCKDCSDCHNNVLLSLTNETLQQCFLVLYLHGKLKRESSTVLEWCPVLSLDCTFSIHDTVMTDNVAGRKLFPSVSWEEGDGITPWVPEGRGWSDPSLSKAGEVHSSFPFPGPGRAHCPEAGEKEILRLRKQIFNLCGIKHFKGLRLNVSRPCPWSPCWCLPAIDTWGFCSRPPFLPLSGEQSWKTLNLF